MMHYRFFTALVVVAAYFTHPLVADEEKTAPQKLSAQELGDLSEAFGHLIGKNISNPNGISFDLNRVIEGIRKAAKGEPSLLSDEQYEQLMSRLQLQAFSELAAKNLEEANAFMEKQATKPNMIVVEPKKLYYEILTAGEGPAVEAGGTPEIHYKGTFLNGDVFDSTERLGQAMAIPIDQTIPGFSRGVVGMREGEKRRLFIHPDLGYGTTGQLPPNSLLIFEIEVVKASTVDEEEVDLDDEDEQSFSIDSLAEEW